MSTNSRKGYDAEHKIEVLLQQRYPTIAANILRPRAGAPNDKGDIHGLPVVISVKNWVEPSLGPWVNEMQAMCRNAHKGVGVVWHKRRGKGKPEDWYVTMDEQSWEALTDKYTGRIKTTRAGIVVSQGKFSGWLRIAAVNLIPDYDVGVLIHNRQGQPGQCFVSMYGEDFLLLLDAYLGARARVPASHG